MDTDAAAAIGAAVTAWFDASSVAQKKHTAREWSVLAGVVLRVVIDRDNSATVRVLATGTGTKCLGRRDLEPGGVVVNDCHAEVVARRALLRYLYSEALRWEREERDDHNTSSIFTRDGTSGKLRLKPRHELHLYISEAPCGDAAIYPLREAVVDALVAKRTQREADGRKPATETETGTETVERSELRLTGAKQKRPRDGDDETTRAHDDADGDKRFQQTVGLARVKSGRSDLPVDKQTLSMSCSDKIARWTIVGVQGALLLRWFEPIFLTSIVVDEDPAGHSRASQQRAMERALRDRVGCSNSSTSSNSNSVVLYVLPSTSEVSPSTRFRLQRDARKTASALSLNWTRQEPRWQAHEPPSTTRDWRTRFFASSDVEVLMAATGFREGAKKATKMDDDAKKRVASRLSKWSFFRAYGVVVGQQQSLHPHRETDGANNEAPVAVARSYQDEKASVVAVAGRRAAHDDAKQAVGAWVGVPDTFKRFLPHVE